jgi:hypothetical protein
VTSPDVASSLSVSDLQTEHLLLQSQLQQQQHHHQQQQQQANKVLLLGIDPDTNGAIAVIEANLLPCTQLLPDSSSSSTEQQQQGQQPLFGVDLRSASIRVHDMPVEQIPLKKKNKSAPQRYRR